MTPDDKEDVADNAHTRVENEETVLDSAPQLAATVLDTLPGPPVEHDPLLGMTLDGKYRMEALLGRGGMGAVYSATQLQLDRRVAVKVVLGKYNAAEGAVARFKREAVAVARLRHPNIIGVYDFGIADGAGAYLVMERLEGRSLRAELAAKGPPPLARVIELMTQVCAAVHAAHEAGVVHRDLKPDNIFLEATAAGTVAKVLDFGIAKLAEGHGNAALTQDGTPMGTPAYMSPEQCEGWDVDARTDVYALGCVVYELLAGRVPFVARTLVAMLRKHLLEPAEPPSHVRPDITPELDAVVLRALAKEPAARFPTAAAFASALITAATGEAPAGVDPATVPLTAAQSTRDAVRETSTGTGVPEPLTSFVGREQHLTALREAITGSRMVTLAGPGGIGKTRLALRLARELARDARDGTWLIELAAIAGSGAAARAVAEVLDIAEEPGRPLAATLGDALRDKEILLVLDNCEHVVEECADLCAGLLRSSAGLRVLATSREVLGVPGEVAWAVPPLELPSAAGATFAEVAASEAVVLFAERARLAKPTFEVTAENAATVGELCRQLDGIPLAIELAAARLRMLTVDQVVAKMADRFRLLTLGGRTAAPRQQTLRAAIDWSHGLLTEDEQTMLRRLSVFAGGWSLEAAEAVCAGDSIDELAILDLTSRLADKSLISQSAQGGEPRYTMLETIREYAREKLADSGAEAATLRAHRDWCAGFAELLRSAPRQGAWSRGFQSERDNLHAAVRWSLSIPMQGDDEASLRLTTALSKMWAISGHWSDGREWLEEALARSPGASRKLRGEALFGLAQISSYLSDYRRTASALDEALELARREDDGPLIAKSLRGRASAALYLGEHDLAFALLEESLDRSRQLGLEEDVAGGLAVLGLACLFVGDYRRALACYEEAAPIRRKLGNRFGEAIVIGNAGEVLCLLGEYDEAWRRLEETERAARELNLTLFVADVRVQQGLVRGGQGRGDEARTLFTEAAAIFREHRSRPGTIDVLEACARVAALAGDTERALCLSEAALVVRSVYGVPRPPYVDAELGRRLGALPESEAEHARALGRAMSVDVALDYALSVG